MATATPRTEHSSGASSPHPARDLTQAIALRPGEAAKALGVGRTTIYREIWAGRLKTCHVGSARLIPQSEIQRWLAEKLDAETTPSS